MQTKFDFKSLDDGRTVYVRRVATADLPLDVQEQAEGVEQRAAHGVFH